MNINIDLPDNLRTKLLLTQGDIPCLCRVGQEFEIIFRSPLQDGICKVTEWDRKQFEMIAPASAGGNFTHYADALISFSRTENSNQCFVSSLRLFYESEGWVSVIEDEQYVTPSVWDEE